MNEIALVAANNRNIWFGLRVIREMHRYLAAYRVSVPEHLDHQPMKKRYRAGMHVLLWRHFDYFPID